MDRNQSVLSLLQFRKTIEYHQFLLPAEASCFHRAYLPSHTNRFSSKCSFCFECRYAMLYRCDRPLSPECYTPPLLLVLHIVLGSPLYQIFLLGSPISQVDE